DHVGGNPDLLAAKPTLRVYGSAGDAPRIPGITNRVHDGDPVEVGALAGRVIMIPAHTSGHVAYHFPAERAVFTGDTLFAGGGLARGPRLGGGGGGGLGGAGGGQVRPPRGGPPARQDHPRLYCGHEYTEKNLRFAAMLEPGNRPLAEKLGRVQALRREGKFTVPSTIGEEKVTNPFLRVESPELVASVRERVRDVPPGDRVALSGAVRGLKARF